MAARTYRLLKIRGVLQQYPWGEVASRALVAKLSGISSLPETATCAELWFGAHPSSPSLLTDLPGSSLAEALKDLGEPPLPFLLKVLSIRKPLSIQAHPNLELARELHARDPIHYPDSNHKPEMGIALTPVRLLYGLREPGEIRDILGAFVPLSEHLSAAGLLGSTGANLSRPLLSALYNLQRGEIAGLVAACSEYFARVPPHKNTVQVSREAGALFLELLQEFSADDVGLLVAPFLNLVTVQPLQAVFVPPHVPHAYLSGELVECMATSDNVVRAGLTGKFQDASTLLSMLSFNPERPDLEQAHSSQGIEWYPRRCAEFQMGLVRSHGVASTKVTLTGFRKAMVLGLRGTVSVREQSETLHLEEGTAALTPSDVGRSIEVEVRPAQRQAAQGIAVLVRHE